ncbi:MAG: acetate--CoA ligase family protein [Chloroflexota bacterium]
MKELFHPRSVVVVGVSDKAINMGRIIVDKLARAGFAEPVHAVGQGGGRLGQQPIYNSILDVPRPVDLAAIVVPAASVPSVLEECGQIGVKWAVIMSAGFSEFSNDRLDLEQAVLEVARRHDIRLIGPNCIGILNASNGLAAFFAPVPLDGLLGGPVTILAQSGSVVMEYAAMLSFHKVGVSKFVSMGNKLATDEADLLRYLIDEDPDTRQIMLYLEGIGDGRKLFEVARRSHKPIVLLKANVVPGGNAAARSHTASLASDDRIVEAMCRQANVVRARNMDQLLDFSKVLSLPPMRGDNLGMITISGGAGVLAVDYCHLHGFTLPALPAPVVADITERAMVKAVARGNPLDLGDNFDNDLVLYAAETLLRLPEIDALLLCPSFDPETARLGVSREEMVRRIAAVSRELHKPALIAFSPYLASLDIIRAQLDYPIFDRPEEAIEALAASRDYWRRRNRGVEPVPILPVDRARVRELIDKARAEERSDLTDVALEVLAAYGLSVERPRLAPTREAAVALAEEIGYPVVVKIQSPDITHKSDVGGVALDLRDAGAVEEAFQRIVEGAGRHRPGARIQGVTLQRMIREGQEVIVGAKRDEQFGPVVMFGLGGVLVELYQDVSFRLAPLTRSDALDMIDEVVASKLLRGFRGAPLADEEAIVDALLRISQLITDFPEIAEVDVNPLKVFAAGHGCRAVDARVFMKRWGMVYSTLNTGKPISPVDGVSPV